MAAPTPLSSEIFDVVEQEYGVALQRLFLTKLLGDAGLVIITTVLDDEIFQFVRSRQAGLPFASLLVGEAPASRL